MKLHRNLRTAQKVFRSRVAFKERKKILQDERIAVRALKSGDLGGQVRIFNLDLHTSVIADLRGSLNSRGDMVSWSCSNHNRFFRPEFQNPDPVAIVNQQTWKRLGRLRVWRFRTRYKKFLSSFDGFVVTYPLAFFLLFMHTRRPILAVIATRFDWPMSRKFVLYSWFVNRIREGQESGQLTILANNAADADFFALKTSLLRPRVVPSLCDYVLPDSGALKRPTRSEGITVQSDRFDSTLLRKLNEEGVVEARHLFPAGYSWDELSEVAFVFFVPYNVSVMLLFELATMGVPVIIPDDDWLIEMALAGENGALSELYFPKSLRLQEQYPICDTRESREADLVWWLERADFANRDLMPNVLRISKRQSFSEFEITRVDKALLAIRNEAVRGVREVEIDKFVEKCRTRF